MQHVFVSYKREDGDFAENLIAKIEKAGFHAWADTMIGAGEEWRTRIDLAIRDSFALIVIMTPEARTSEYVTYEWAFAWGVGIRVIPVILRRTDMHPRLEALQHLDFTGGHAHRPWGTLMQELRDAANAPLINSISVPLSSPPFVRRAVVALDSANAQDRKAAVTTLEAAGTPTAHTVLCEALRHPLPDVRNAALEALGRIGDPSAVEAVISLLRDTEPTGVREVALMTLARIGSPAAVDAVCELMRDPNRSVQEAAVRALSGIGDPSAMGALVDASRDPDPALRRSVVWALLQIGDPGAVDVLTHLLNDHDREVRCAAAKALGDIGGPAAVPPLVELSRNLDPTLQRAAAMALGQIGDPSAAEALAQLLRAPAGHVQAAASAALVEIGGEAVKQAARMLMHDPRGRDAAENVLRSVLERENPI